VYTLAVADDGSHGVTELKQLAAQTGGRVFFPASRRSLNKTFAQVRDEIRSQYALSYIPSDFSPNGRFRRIELKVLRAGKALHVRARKGYYAQPLAMAQER
jgi:VWFA-related protein